MTREEAINIIRDTYYPETELKALEVLIPELAESEDERIRKFLIDILSSGVWRPEWPFSPVDCVAYLEKQKERPTDAKSERVIKAARRVLNNWLDGTDCPDVSGDFGELEFAFREYDGEEKQSEASNVEKAMREIEEKAKAFTEAHKGETADEILAQMRGEGWSEDERIRKALIKIVEDAFVETGIEGRGLISVDGFKKNDFLIYLEKQKINTEGDFGRGYDCGYQAGYAVATGEMKPKVATATLYAEEQKEQKQEVKDPFDDEQFMRGYEAAIREQMPDIDLLKRPWYLRGYYDGKCSMEPIWVVKAEKGGTRFYENPNYGKPLEQKEQKTVEWSEDIIRKAVKEVGLTQYQIDWFKTNVFPPKQGWSEEDENMLNSCISSIEEAKENRYYYRETDGDTSYDHEISWLKSLSPRPHWTPSEEHLSALLAIINDPNNIWSQTCQLALSDLHEQLKWLKKIEDNANEDNA